MLLTDATLPDQFCVAPPCTMRCDRRPSLPTSWLTRASSEPNVWLAMITSFRLSATLPATPVHSSGIRAVKSPSLSWAKTASNTFASTGSARVTAVFDTVASV